MTLLIYTYNHYGPLCFYNSYSPNCCVCFECAKKKKVLPPKKSKPPDTKSSRVAELLADETKVHGKPFDLKILDILFAFDYDFLFSHAFLSL